jgi:hypothetical protein
MSQSKLRLSNSPRLEAQREHAVTSLPQSHISRIAKRTLLATSLVLALTKACASFGSAPGDSTQDGSVDSTQPEDTSIPNDSSDTSIRLDGAVDVIATTDGSQDAINEVIVDTASLDVADVVVDAGIEAGDDGSADVITTDATDATPPLPPFPPCTLNLGGGAALADVNVQGANSSAEKMRIISDGREEYRVGPHIFRLLRTNNILPALAVLSGDGRSEMSFDARLGAQAVYSASVFTVQDRIPNCAVNIEGEPCLTRLLDALQCEEVKTTPLSGCPPVIGFTYEGQKTIHESIGAGRKLILSVIGNCPL